MSEKRAPRDSSNDPAQAAREIVQQPVSQRLFLPRPVAELGDDHAIQ